MRFPPGTPYQGPLACYDEQIPRDDIIRRLVYGKPKPLLAKGERLRYGFYGRLLEQLSNGHAAFVKEGWLTTLHQLKREIMGEIGDVIYAAEVFPDDADPQRGALIIYNKVGPHEGGHPVGMQWFEPERSAAEWVDTREAARILGVSVTYAGTLARQAGATDTQRYGGQRRMLIRRDALPALANRPGRHRRKRRYDV